jgi:pimeloyl-ACP methyl ester carboxylesterase
MAPDREPLEASVPGGSLRGWAAGAGEPLLLLHGGPGLSAGYLDELALELAAGYRVATFQQRGLRPSTLDGPFTVARAVEDTLAVLDALRWERPLVVGHSWGGHLALRLVAAAPDRLQAALAVEPLGIVGDGGMAAFEAEMMARTPAEDRRRAHELDERALAGLGTPAEALESLRIFWPGYFADPEHVPEMPPLELSVEAYSGIIGDTAAGADEVVAELAGGRVPYGVLAGTASPIPWGQASRASAEVSPRAFLALAPGAGHFPWVESPGCVQAALERLRATSRADSRS